VLTLKGGDDPARLAPRGLAQEGSERRAMHIAMNIQSG